MVGRQLSADGSTVLATTTRGYAGVFAVGSHVQRVPCDAGPQGCVPMRSFGNTYVGMFMDDGTGRQTAQIQLTPNSRNGADEPVVTGGRFVDATGRYYVYQASSTGKQYVDAVQRYRTDDVRVTRSVTAASVWGANLWTPGTGNGVVTAYDLEKRKTVATVSTGAPCKVKELQVVGRWIYWNCGPTGAAGVYDRTAKKKITVPAGPVLVGDGYLVRHDRAAGALMLTDFHTGTAAAPRAVADLPAGNTADQRRLTWTVDKFGGDIAYARGRAERTITGRGAHVEIDWDLKSDSGAYLANGPKTWSLTAAAEEGGGRYTTGGPLGYNGGLQGFHDQGYYSYGELVTLNSSGALTLHFTKGKGTFDFKASGSGWPAGTVAVPFGDMGADRCAELLVRMPNGELRRYKGRCGAAYTPSNSHTSLGKAWNAYNVLTAPGDLTGDGRTDLLARKASTGDVYLFADDGAGKLKRGVKIGTWSAYRKIVGAGDLNGDGFGDVLALDKAGTLWRYDGTGAGRVKARVKVFSGWGASYNAVVGVGDITADGKNDLVVRDTAGNLYRQAGTGKGSFASRVRIATGWKGYKGLF
ncbi:FG-GAP repeat domain-containing protein [Streptomyces shenzhenensis]|uniref:FG-GAP repeat domain-containing protein n=1 Tax=Streptomyces shenzhenensis TaxID=943815 RepID=UPI0033C3032B